MKPPQRNSVSWEAVFAPLIIIPWLNHGTPVDATAARNVLIYRTVISLIGVFGMIGALIWRAQQKAKTPPVPGTAPASAVSAANPWDSRGAQTAISVSYQTNRTNFPRTQWKSLKARPVNFVGWGLILLIPLVIVVGIDVDKDAFSILTVGKALLAVVGVVAFFAGVMYLEFRQRYPRPDSVRNCTTYLSPDGFHDVTPSGTAYFAWSDIKNIRNLGGDIFFQNTGAAGCFVPREAFSSEESAARFYEAALTLWRSKGAEMPSPALVAEFSLTRPSGSEDRLKMPLPFDLNDGD